MNDLNTLMSRIEEINAKSPTELVPADIDTIIKYHRTQRARRAAGEKPAKPTAASGNLSDIMGKLKPKSNFVRRI